MTAIFPHPDDQSLEEQLKNLSKDAYISAYCWLTDIDLKNKLRTELGLSEDIENDLRIKNVPLQEVDLKIATQDAYFKVYKALIVNSSPITTVTDILLHCAEEWQIDTETQTLLLDQISDDDIFQLWEYSTEQAEKTESNSNSQPLAIDQVVDKKFGLHYSTRKKTDSTRLSASYGGGQHKTTKAIEIQQVRERTFGFEFGRPNILNYVPSCNQVSSVTDECCWVERTPILEKDNIWLKGDPGFPEQEQCFPNQSQHKTTKAIDQVVDKKFGLHYSTRKKTDSTRLSTSYGGASSASKQFGEPSDAL